MKLIYIAGSYSGDITKNVRKAIDSRGDNKNRICSLCPAFEPSVGFDESA